MILNDKESSRLNSLINDANLLQTVLGSDAWAKIIHPHWENAIIQIVGGKIGDKFVGGKIDKCLKDEKLSFYIGYKKGLMDLYNTLQGVILDGEKAKKTLEKVEKQKKSYPENKFAKIR